MKRLLPDFFRPQNDHPPARVPPSLNSALPGMSLEIIAAKRQAAQQVLDTVPNGGGRFELTTEDAHAWVAAVNDVRLCTGHDARHRSGGFRRVLDHPMAGHFDVYQWLTVLQGIWSWV